MAAVPVTAPIEDDRRGRQESASRRGPRRLDLRSQVPIPCWFMRGGTSRGPFFRATDVPPDPVSRDAILLSAIGSPDPRQIDGLGGATSLTSKAGIVGLSSRPDVDLEFLFAQLQPESEVVDTRANCGNMLAAVVPFAVESGLIEPVADQTTARVLTLNTQMTAEITILTPLGSDGRRFVQYAGDSRIDGVPGTAAPVMINFTDTAGSVAPGLFPTGNVVDTVAVDGIGDLQITCIDNGQPLVIVRAEALGVTGQETPRALETDSALTSRIEHLRLVAGELMGLGDVRDKNYPKMTLVSPPLSGGTINTRSFIPHRCHDAIGVLAAVTAATACVVDGTVARQVANPPTRDSLISIEHPSGELSVDLTVEPRDPVTVTRSALLRTARLIMAGQVLVPAAVLSAPTAVDRGADRSDIG